MVVDSLACYYYWILNFIIMIELKTDCPHTHTHTNTHKYKHYITKIVKIGPANSKSFGLHEWKALLVDEWMSFNSTQVYERTKVSSENCKHHSLFKNPFPWIGSTIDHQTDKTNLSQLIRLVQFSHLQCWHC